MDPVLESFGEQLKELCCDRFGGVPGFAAKYDLPPQTLYTQLRNTPVVFSARVLLAFAEEFNLDPFELERQRIVPNAIASVGVPLLGGISAGQPLEMISTAERYPIPADIAERYPRAFLLRVNGESMNKVLPNGAYALVDPCKQAEVSGVPYVVAVGNGDATVKRVRVLNNGVELTPDSTDPTFRSRLYDFSEPEVESIRIIGRVVWYCVPVDWRF